LLPTPAGAPSTDASTAAAPVASWTAAGPVAVGGAAATIPSSSAPEPARIMLSQVVRQMSSSVSGRTHGLARHAGSVSLAAPVRRR
jgi:hypothetical protein